MAAPCARVAPNHVVVVIVEMDFESVSDLMRRRLFVGWARAQWRLACVMSFRAEKALAERLG